MSTDSLTSLSGRGRAVHGEVVVRGYVFVGHGDPQVCREKHACECVLSALIACYRGDRSSPGGLSSGSGQVW